ncbi:hypothetical protein JKP88DRAFT_347858 [Tribonema minus]|uniref:Protein kinase domain-containing protein n=1 Tax=Tribonema minus TaxID=303371 RepID=A0A835ZDX2_9STRA|nr:hypothetical protein JKP88DRAFT_347858 [Tribonema minus]
MPYRLPKVYGTLPANSSYVGTFHYAPSAGNRARQTYFEKAIRSMDQINKQHAILTNPHIGIFHYGDYVYGERFAELQLSLRQFHDRRSDMRRRQSTIYDDDDVNQMLMRANSFSSNEGASAAEPDGHGGERKDTAASVGVCEEVRMLRRSAFATLIYASGDNLCKLAERERRRGHTRRFKYNGAIDLYKRYPGKGSIDDCALMRPLGAGRSKQYNDLMADVNGFRRHFVEQRKASTLNPKEAYRRARLKEMEEVDEGYEHPAMVLQRKASDVQQFWQPNRRRKVRSSSEASSSPNLAPTPVNEENLRALSRTSTSIAAPPNTPSFPTSSSSTKASSFFSGGTGGGNSVSVSATGTGGGEAAGLATYVTQQRHGSMGLQNGYTTAQLSQAAMNSQNYVGDEAAGRGDTWFPGTVSAQLKKESWKNKQTMRDTSKFKTFFVQAKSQIHDAYDLYQDRLLGQGSYAKVILGRHMSTGQLVAIKAVQKRLLFSDSEKACVLHEVENQLRIVHRHIVRLYEVYETPNHLYLVLEMIYMRGFLKEIEAKRVAKQLLQAVAYLHAKGIVHCDIKPQNLLFTHDTTNTTPTSAASSPPSDRDRAHSAMQLGDFANGAEPPPPESPSSTDAFTSPAGLLAKLCDFGLSRKVPDIKFFKLTGDVNKIPFSTLCGTGGFIAPEIMRQQPFGKAADMWSVGVMIYQMLCGRMPFMPARACLERPPSYLGATWRNVSEEAKDLINKMLERDPSKRLTAAEALEHPWLESVQYLESGFPHFVPTAAPKSSAATAAQDMLSTFYLPDGAADDEAALVAWEGVHAELEVYDRDHMPLGMEATYIIYCREQMLTYVLNQKAGSSTTASVLNEHFHCTSTQHDWVPEHIKQRRCYDSGLSSEDCERRRARTDWLDDGSISGMNFFSVVREPIARFKSGYQQAVTSTPELQGWTISEYLAEYRKFPVNEHTHTQARNLSGRDALGRQVPMHFIASLENLEHDLTLLWDELGLPPMAHYPHARSKEDDPNKAVLDTTLTADQMRELCDHLMQDFVCFGYTLPEECQ